MKHLRRTRGGCAWELLVRAGNWALQVVHMALSHICFRRSKLLRGVTGVMES